MTEAMHQLEVSRVINASAGRLFEAWTTPDMIVQWWGAGGITCPEAEMDLAVGGRYRIANRTPDGAVMWISGIFSKVDPPHELAYTWGMEPIDDAAILSLVEVTFTSENDGTLVTVRQTQIATPEAREMHLAGWVGCLAGLERLLSS